MRVLLAALLFAGGCAAQTAQLRAEPGRPLRVEALGLACAVGGASLEGDELAQLGRALQRAAPRLRPWGTFRAPLRLELLVDHAALEERSGQRASPWLRAWSSGAVILLQRPGSWPEAAGRSDEEVEALLAQLLAHELADALARAAAGARGRRRRAPRRRERRGRARGDAAALVSRGDGLGDRGRRARDA